MICELEASVFHNFSSFRNFTATFVAMDKSKAIVLGDLLSATGMNLNLSSNDRESVLGELVNQIPALTRHPEARATLLRALQEREQLHSTGIGDGIAPLPHARNALTLVS